MVTNYNNESISFIDLATRKVVKELDLRPRTAYVSSARDREVVVVDFTTVTAPKIVTRIEVAGNPLKTILDKTQSYLYVTEDNSDLVDIITTSNSVFPSWVISIPPATPGKSPGKRATALPTVWPLRTMV